MYYGLIRDINRSSDVNHTFSDGYDVAQTAICFLCEHIGHKLGDETGKYRAGKPVTVKHACYTEMERYLGKIKVNLKNNRCIDDLHNAEPVAEFEWHKEEQTTKI